MERIFNLSKIAIGFVGGVAFIVSCGGDYTNQAEAFNIQSQLFCVRTGSSILNTVFEESVSAAGQALDCIDSSGNSYVRSNLADIYADGWKIQIITDNKEYVFSR